MSLGGGPCSAGTPHRCRAYQNYRIVPIGSFYINEQASIGIDILSDRLQGCARYGGHELYVVRIFSVLDDVSDNPRLRGRDSVSNQCALFVCSYNAGELESISRYFATELRDPLSALDRVIEVLEYPGEKLRYFFSRCVHAKPRPRLSAFSFELAVPHQLLGMEPKAQLLL